jgi:hypothetical protein
MRSPNLSNAYAGIVLDMCGRNAPRIINFVTTNIGVNVIHVAVKTFQISTNYLQSVPKS